MSEETILDPPASKRPKLSEVGDEEHVIGEGERGKVKSEKRVEEEEGWSREVSTGVCTFINTESEPFTCIFKHRFSDFIVNEIDEEGNILKLTTMKPVLEGEGERGNEEKSKEVGKGEREEGVEGEEGEKREKEEDWDGLKREMEEQMEKEGGRSEEVEKLIGFAQRVSKALKEGVLGVDEKRRKEKKGKKEEGEEKEGKEEKLDDEEEEEKRREGDKLKKEELMMKCEGKSKAWRGEFHQKIRNLFPNLRSETVMKDKDSYMKIWYGKDKYDRREEKRSKQVAKYLKCVMKKENKDSTDAIHSLTRLLGFKSGQIRFAGTKDKRGITTQALTMPFIDPVQASKINSKLASFNMKIGNFSATNNHLGLGSLKGNHFRVILRNIKLASHLNYPGKSSPSSSFQSSSSLSHDITIAALQSSCEKFAQTGFINYYGMQRFGTGSVRTHEVGLECLRGNWQQVINNILKPRDGEREDASRARILFQSSGNASETLKIMPKFMSNERFILSALASSPKDFKGAFLRLARPMRLMYPHAYQSYIWNMAASKRIQLYGYKVVVGDLVMIDINSLSERLDDDILQTNDGINPSSSSIPFKSNDHITNHSLSHPKINENHPSQSSSSPSHQAMRPIHRPPEDSPLGPRESSMLRIIQTEEEASQYSMSQVVLPLPGPLVCLPDNEVGVYIESLLEKDGLSMNFENDREFHLSGSYRALIVKPNHFSFNILRYIDQDGLLQPTEEDLLLQETSQDKQTLATISYHSNSNDDSKDNSKSSSLSNDSSSSSSSHDESKSKSENQSENHLIALQLSFSLQSSSYASMLVRELVKQPLDQSFLREKFSTTSPPISMEKKENSQGKHQQKQQQQQQQEDQNQQISPQSNPQDPPPPPSSSSMDLS